MKMDMIRIKKVLTFYVITVIGTGVCDDCVHTYYSDSVHYNGTVARSVHGNPCLRWDTLHDIVYLTDKSFPDDGSVSEANNYCRDPFKTREDIFCYTMNPDIQSQQCSIPYCDDPTKEHILTIDGELMRCTEVPESGRCEEEDLLYYCKDTEQTVWSKSRRDACENLFCCMPRGCWDGPSHEYNGTWRHTLDGTPCKDWIALIREDPDPLNMPEQSLNRSMNYCRDPELKGYPYCVTNKRGFRGRLIQQSCEIPSCDDYYTRHGYNHDCYTVTDKDRQMNQEASDGDICESDPGRFVIEDEDEVYPGCLDCTCCQKKGCFDGDIGTYTGTWSKTRSGWPCQPWTETRFKDDAWRFADANVADAASYCRHTTNHSEGQLWCVTANPHTVEEECNIPHCDDVTSSTASTTPTTTTTTTATTIQTTQTSQAVTQSGISTDTTAIDPLSTTLLGVPENTAAMEHVSQFIVAVSVITLLF